MEVLAAGFWGFVGGAHRSLRRRFAARHPRRDALGAGVLISSVAFELMQESYEVGGFDAATVGLVLGRRSTPPPTGL